MVLVESIEHVAEMSLYLLWTCKSSIKEQLRKYVVEGDNSSSVAATTTESCIMKIYHGTRPSNRIKIALSLPEGIGGIPVEQMVVCSGFDSMEEVTGGGAGRVGAAAHANGDTRHRCDVRLGPRWYWS